MPYKGEDEFSIQEIQQSERMLTKQFCLVYTAFCKTSRQLILVLKRNLAHEFKSKMGVRVNNHTFAN